MRACLLYVCLALVGCGNLPQSKKSPTKNRPGDAIGGLPSAVDLGANCTAGVLGCACDATGSCTGDSFCNSHFICALTASGCTLGEVDCGCSGGSCDSGLVCIDNVCHDNTGLVGGPCLDATHCHTAARCADGVCVACSPGEQGCTCANGNACNETLQCTDSICVTGIGYAAAPANATAASCVTPCSGPLVAPDGTYVACPSSGVMDGCLTGLTCAQGQCLCSGSKPTTCTADVDCPDFETCLDGYCRANCNADTDCQAGAICHRRVCRKSCDIGTPNCPNGNICEPLDGQSGVCLMQADTLVTAGTTAAVLTLSTGALRFTPSSSTNQVTITNTSSFDSGVILRKYQEREPNPNGALNGNQMPVTVTALQQREIAPTVDSTTCVTGTRGCSCGSNSANPCVSPSQSYSLVCQATLCQLPTCTAGTEGCACTGSDCQLLCEPGRCPLTWVTFDVSVAGSAILQGVKDTVVDFVLPAGQTATVTVGSTSQSGPWDGLIEVEPTGAGATRQQLAVSYANTPDGSWAGTVDYFGDFLVAKGFGAWETALNSGTVTDALVDGIGNAFLQEWANFRRGKISYHTLQAVLTSTRTGSWSLPQLSAVCNAGGSGTKAICFPDDSTQGYQVYTENPNDSPVPGGVVELPFSMVLSAVNKTFYQGAIDSTQALQYPGSPAIAIGFANDPSACTPDADANCVSYINNLQMSSAIGGRFNAPSGAGSCALNYQAVTMPWLVPGFAGRSTLDANGNPSVSECQNGALSAANPLIDGTARTRSFTLIDGAVINGDTMIILFSESTPPLAGSDANSAITEYGLLSLKRKNGANNVAPVPVTVPTATPPTGAAPNVSCYGAAAVLDPLAPKIGNGYANTAALLAAAQTLQGNTGTTLWPQIVRGLMTGSPIDQTVNKQPTMNVTNGWSLPSSTLHEQVHYLCEDTQLFEGGGGSGADGGSAGTQCPVGSRVTYFTVNSTVLSNAAVQGHACQSTGTCDVTLKNWIAEGGYIVNGSPSWRCDNGADTCNQDNFEMRSGKDFYPINSDTVYLPIASAVDEAFRYRTRFVNRAGTNVGFAPDICTDDQQTQLYCYSPGRHRHHRAALQLSNRHLSQLRQ